MSGRRSAGIRPTLESDHALTLTLDAPRKLSIEPDGKKRPLLLFANPIEADAPKPGDPGVIFFGPGVDKPGRIDMAARTRHCAGPQHL